MVVPVQIEMRFAVLLKVPLINTYFYLYYDFINQFYSFINENIIKDNCVGIGRNELSDRFRIWFKNNIGEKVPKLNELIEAMNKKFGERNKGNYSN